MKKLLRYFLIATSAILLLSCGKDTSGNGDSDPKNSFSLNREDIIGCWKVIQAKYDEDAKMTAWEFEDTYAEFKENGLYVGEGYFGKGTGTYTISGNVITTKIDNVPFIVYEVYGFEGEQVSLLATIQSSQQKIWMYCEKAKSLEETPNEGYTDETFIQNENQLNILLSGIYYILTDFAKKETEIENLIISKHLEQLTPQSPDILNLWSSAYQLLNRINTTLGEITQNQYSGKYGRYEAHLRGLRAFVAYNLATLWGNVFYTESAPQLDTKLTVWNASDILNSAMKDIEISLTDYTFASLPTWRFFNPTAKVILAGEIALTNGDFESANSWLPSSNIDNLFETDAIFDLLITNEDNVTTVEVPVYTKYILSLLQQEAKKNITSIIVSKDYPFGFCRFMKRMGNADYQLLLPIPETEIRDGLTQNPGY